MSLLTDHDIYLFKEGTHTRLYEKLGAHLISLEGKNGVFFAVWAPNARQVTVTGDFNEWNKQAHPLHPREDESGIWEGFIPGLGKGSLYKYYIESRENDYAVEKRDPYGFFNEIPPHTASVVWDLHHTWGDSDWMATRGKKNALEKPISIYELHLGSWRKTPDDTFVTYRDLAEPLVSYVKESGFTHVEFLPVTEYPFFGSWGYQTIGYFSPTSRFGYPEEFMELIDTLHQNDIGVILDWVPSHFPSDEHGLVYFDGTHLFEHDDPRKGFHPDWKSYIFNLGRNEVKDFLLSSAFFWCDKYHIDGLRVDAVASMLYLDYSRKEGEWIPNKFGGRENLESIDFLRTLNTMLYESFPDIQTIAEESTSWPGVSAPVDSGGLGFGLKWNMGWMHDTLSYFSKDPVYRKHHHNELTFSFVYAFSENFVIALSHDEVVHGKKSLLAKMPGDAWQQTANLRLLLGYLFAYPGKKLLFMGAEFGQWNEWNHDKSLDWHLLNRPEHAGIYRWVQALNRLYRSEPALHERDVDPEGFQCVDANDWEQSVIALLRYGRDREQPVLAVCNFTPVLRERYKVGVPAAGFWKEIANSDAAEFGGSNAGNFGGAETIPIARHGFYNTLSVTLPPLGIVFFKAPPHA
ncbi:MAG TPA: 1,4-alpha-glucan branching protein GlgB [Spirochaetia bacterium]|nr:1,4-alpha-glucan branching protein GlgB [Spirochaetia bacterium]